MRRPVPRPALAPPHPAAFRRGQGRRLPAGQDGATVGCGGRIRGATAPAGAGCGGCGCGSGGGRAEEEEEEEEEQEEEEEEQEEEEEEEVQVGCVWSHGR